PCSRPANNSGTAHPFANELANGVLSLHEPDAKKVKRLLVEQQSASPSYPEIGSTAGTLPPGYRHDRYAARLGVGERSFQRAADGLRTWEAQRRAGVAVHTATA